MGSKGTRRKKTEGRAERRVEQQEKDRGRKRKGEKEEKEAEPPEGNKENLDELVISFFPVMSEISNSSSAASTPKALVRKPW